MQRGVVLHGKLGNHWRMYPLRGRTFNSQLPSSMIHEERKQSQSIMSTSNRKTVEDIFGSLVGTAATNFKLTSLHRSGFANRFCAERDLSARTTLHEHRIASTPCTSVMDPM